MISVRPKEAPVKQTFSRIEATTARDPLKLDY